MRERTSRQVAMGEIVTYKPDCYCQIRLDTGDRILISATESGIKIIRLTCMGLVPGNVIARWGRDSLGSAIDLFRDNNSPDEALLDAIKNKLIPCQSLSEVKEVCGQ